MHLALCVSLDGFLLDGEKLFDSSDGQVEHGVKGLSVEWFALGGALHLYELAFVRHDHIHVDVGVDILGVAEVEHRRPADYACADGGEAAVDGVLRQKAAPRKFVHGESEGDHAPGDAGAARPAIGVNDVAVDVDRARAKFFQVAAGAEASADQALDLVGAPSGALVALAACAVGRRAGEHLVFGGQPSTRDLLDPHPRGHLLGDHCRADDSGVAEGYKDGARGIAQIARDYLDLSQLIRLSPVKSACLRHIDFSYTIKIGRLYCARSQVFGFSEPRILNPGHVEDQFGLIIPVFLA